ncbi:hypothetical protein ACFL6X_05895 [Candidatus Latescibacterota bacterium]
MSRPDWRGALVLGAAFAIWSGVAIPVLPLYAQVVVPAASAILRLIEPHGVVLSFTESFPSVTWELDGAPESLRRVPFRLLAYNLVLYLSVVTAWPRLGAGRRLLVAVTGLPILYLFHVLDLMLAVESRLLTVLRPESYDLSERIDLWFLGVKYYHSFSVLALKQVLPVLLVWVVVQVLERLWLPTTQDGEGAPPVPEETPA